MRVFRNLFFWLVLALVGALLAQFLLRDPGYVLVRFHGYDYTTTVATAAVAIIAALLVLWLVWTLVTLPFRAWRGHRDRRARARLGDGLVALHRGHYERAEKLLAQAADDDDTAAVARTGAAQAAWARGDVEAARAHVAAIGDAPARAVAAAELALQAQRPTDALVALDAPDAQPLPPRGLALRAQALAAIGKAGEAYGLLGSLRQQQALPAAQLDALQSQWAEAALREAGDANMLADRWEALPKPLKAEPRVVLAYAERAAALRWDEAAMKAIEQALDAAWDETLAARYGSLPIGRFDERYARAERWLPAHADSPALLLTLARLARATGRGAEAEDFLRRALDHGAGAEAWEELGHGRAAAGDDALARTHYANALRAARGDTALVPQAQPAVVVDDTVAPAPIPVAGQPPFPAE